MALIDLKTDLKSLKYGNDIPGGGSSNQPYIKTPLTVPSALSKYLGTDFLLRGGVIGAPLESANDIARLAKYFADFKSPSGILFIAKQNLLSRVAVRTQAGEAQIGKRLLNDGIYTPLSTLAQAGVSAFGLHFNKQGLNPIPGSIGSLVTYSDIVNSNEPISSNRLVDYYNRKIEFNGFLSTDGINVLDKYIGGPGSILGIGKTFINFADQRTGLNNPSYGKNFFYLDGKKNSLTNREGDENNIILPIGVSTYYDTYIAKNNTLSTLNDLGEPKPIQSNINPSSSSNFQYQISPADSAVVNLSSFPYNVVYSYDELTSTDSYKDNTKKVFDFRAKLRKNLDKLTNEDAKTSGYNILSNSPSYDVRNIETRVNLGDPGNPFGKNIRSYVKGVGREQGNEQYNGAASIDSFDKLTVLPLYKSSGPTESNLTNDLVQFRIAAIDNTKPNNKVFMHFRAFIDSFSDSYTSNWSPSQYVGRGESFYTYDGFGRTVSLSFTVAAQSKIELIAMFKKLNFLASNLAPDYSGAGYMRGPLVQLTIGGYLREMPGFITALTYDVPQDASWEIGIDDTDNIKGYDSTVKELPQMIKVTGFSFTPIHPFVPRKVVDHNNQKTKFIALSTVGHRPNDGSNYDSKALTLADLKANDIENQEADASNTKESPQDNL